MATDVVFITGAAGGIGRATALEFAARGFQPVVTGSAPPGRPGETGCEQVGGVSLDLDVSDPQAVDRAIREAQDRHGPIDTAVCCAGFDVDLRLQQTDDYVWRRSLAVLLGGCVNVTAAAISPSMKERGHGSIVLIFIGAAIIGEENHVSYVTAKAAVCWGSLGRWRTSWGRTGSGSTPSLPDRPDTPMLTDPLPREREEYRNRLPLKRFGAAHELAKAIADVSGQTWTTGQIVSPNGGIVIQ